MGRIIEKRLVAVMAEHHIDFDPPAISSHLNRPDFYMSEPHGYDEADWPEGVVPPICEFCGIVVDRQEAEQCEGCGCTVHDECLSSHEEECIG